MLSDFTLTAEMRDEDKDLTLAMLIGLRDALVARQVRLGALKTRGLGKVALVTPTFGRVQTNTCAGIFALLNGKEDLLKESDLVGLHGRQRELPRLDISINWEPNGPLMVKAGFDGIAVDMLPLLSSYSMKNRGCPGLAGQLN